VLSSSDTGPYLNLDDDRGKTRMAISLVANQPVLSLLNEQGKPAVMLVVAPNGSLLSFHDSSGNARGAFGVAEQRGQRLVTLKLSDERDKAQVMLSVPDSSLGHGPGLLVQDEGPKGSTIISSSSVSLMDGSDSTRATLTLVKGLPFLAFNDDFKKARVLLGAVPVRTGMKWSLHISDGDGNTLWASP